MQKTKILVIMPYIGWGGVERVMATLLHSFDRKKFTPILLTLQDRRMDLDDFPKDIKIINLNISRARFAMLSIRKVIISEEPDIVFSAMGHLNLLISVFRIIFPKKVIFIARETNTVSSRNQEEQYPKLFNLIYRYFYANFDCIITQSQKMKKDLIENYHISSTKIVTIYNPVDISRIEHLEHQHLDENFDNKKINLLAVGRLTYQKGFDILIKVVAQLPSKFHLIIIGKGEDESSLKKLVEKMEISEKVTFAGYQANPYPFMQQSDVLVMSSRYEGLPNVVLEAFISGLPVITFDSPGGMSEIITTQNGVLVDTGNIKAMTKAISIFDKNLYNKEVIKSEARQKYAADKIVREYESVFINLLQSI